MSDEGQRRVRHYRCEHIGDQYCRQCGNRFDPVGLDCYIGNATTYISAYLGNVHVGRTCLGCASITYIYSDRHNESTAPFGCKLILLTKYTNIHYVLIWFLAGKSFSFALCKKAELNQPGLKISSHNLLFKVPFALQPCCPLLLSDFLIESFCVPFVPIEGDWCA